MSFIYTIREGKEEEEREREKERERERELPFVSISTEFS